MSYLLDTVAPGAPRVTLARTAGGPDMAFETSAEAGAALRCAVLRDGKVVRAEVGCAASRTTALNGLADGPVTVSVIAVDAAGNRSRASTMGYRLDGTAPDAPEVSVAGPSAGGTAPTFRVQAEADATVVLPGCGAEEAVAIAERLRKATTAGSVGLPVTASVGVATYPSDAADGATLIAVADSALYAAKGAGRDQTARLRQHKAGLMLPRPTAAADDVRRAHSVPTD